MLFGGNMVLKPCNGLREEKVRVRCLLFFSFFNFVKALKRSAAFCTKNDAS